MLSKIKCEIEASIDAKQRSLKDDALLGGIAQLAKTSIQCLEAGGKIILAGNGGSFSDAQHLATEFVCRLRKDRAPLPALALGTNASLTTAISNDYGYDHIFSRELHVLASQKDLFIPISTSGNSANILKAIETANKLGLQTIALTGETGGKLADLCSCIKAPSTITARIQECHILYGHIMCELVEQHFFPDGEKE
ncbi:MAG: SIS domain-containing protein [Cohaesibacter sp.]|nr:SIS domain-containing protein [Cohaesibacter sp.]